MARVLIDLLWRDHPLAPRRGGRGPRSRLTTSEVVTRAVAVADDGSLDDVTIRALADGLSISAMSVYTHVNTREDLLVLMADHAHATMDLPLWDGADWQVRVRRLAEANLALFLTHPWLGQVGDPRIALGPGTIAKYDHELVAFADTALSDVDRDAALSFVLDFVRAAAAAQASETKAAAFSGEWSQTAVRLGRYLGQDYPLAQRVGRAAGEAMGGPYDATHAWAFGLARVIAGLADVIDQ